jgi:hypothetical protein
VLVQPSFAAYTVPDPANVRCRSAGIGSGTLVWDAVTPPSGATVSYDVTQPDARVVNVTTNLFNLPGLSLLGNFTVQTRLSAGGWRSTGVTVNVTNVAGILLC